MFASVCWARLKQWVASETISRRLGHFLSFYADQQVELTEFIFADKRRNVQIFIHRLYSWSPTVRASKSCRWGLSFHTNLSNSASPLEISVDTLMVKKDKWSHLDFSQHADTASVTRYFRSKFFYGPLNEDQVLEQFFFVPRTQKLKLSRVLRIHLLVEMFRWLLRQTIGTQNGILWFSSLLSLTWRISPFFQSPYYASMEGSSLTTATWN